MGSLKGELLFIQTTATSQLDKYAVTEGMGGGGVSRGSEALRQSLCGTTKAHKNMSMSCFYKTAIKRRITPAHPRQ